MKKIQLLLVVLCHSLWSQNTVNYTASNAIFANPERGFQKYSITNANYATTPNYSNISISELNNWYNGTDKVSVIFRYFLLEDFLTTNINATYLSNMQLDFDRIKAAGLKCIVRFSYSNAEGTAPQQASKAQILSHISQLEPLLYQNKDIIVTHQAGFIGTWGEWYYTNSSEFGTEDSITPTQWLNRKEVVDAMLNATPVEIPIQLRYPLLKKTMYGNTPLTPATAYQNTALARIGFFNDPIILIRKLIPFLKPNGELIITMPNTPHTLIQMITSKESIPLNVTQSLYFGKNILKPYLTKNYKNIKFFDFKNELKFYDFTDFYDLYKSSTFFLKKKEKKIKYYLNKSFNKSLKKNGYFLSKKSALTLILKNISK